MNQDKCIVGNTDLRQFLKEDEKRQVKDLVFTYQACRFTSLSIKVKFQDC